VEHKEFNMRGIALIVCTVITLALLSCGSDSDNGIVDTGHAGPPDPVYPNIWDDPVWSPDGNTIGCSKFGIISIDKTGFAIVDTSLRGFYLMDADGTNMRRKTSVEILSPSCIQTVTVSYFRFHGVM
jgi:hypothetical protein